MKGADRTAELRKYGYPGRNLQKLQMTTDTAVRVTRLVIEGQRVCSTHPKRACDAIVLTSWGRED